MHLTPFSLRVLLPVPTAYDLFLGRSISHPCGSFRFLANGPFLSTPLKQRLT